MNNETSINNDVAKAGKGTFSIAEALDFGDFSYRDMSYVNMLDELTRVADKLTTAIGLIDSEPWDEPNAADGLNDVAEVADKDHLVVSAFADHAKIISNMLADSLHNDGATFGEQLECV